ncbi:hypothetical protein [Lysinibacillus sp. LZ02]|uniref:hypothetical protein n=1 Tax=Lysinibacillus sp. LZ02 TaxID=3420668 RepID=UPI003D368DFF
MKKLSLYIVFVFLLVACGDGEAKSNNTISDAALSDREKTLLNAAAGNILFTYDFSIESAGALEVWMEKYEYGELTEEQIGGVGTEVNKSGQIIVTLKEVPQSKETIVRVAIVNGGAVSSSEGLMTLPDIGSFGYGSLISNEPIALKGNMAIGQIIYSGESNFFKTSWAELANNPVAIIKELKDRPVVYLIRTSFKEIKSTS